MSKPKKLYKYEAFTVQSLKNLKSQTLYFGSPLNFNDPYDCAIPAKITEPTTSDISILRDYFSRNAEIPYKTREILKDASNEYFHSVIKSISESKVRPKIENIMKGIGITCFSKCNSEHLMWSHYAGKQTGFCLEFDTKADLFSRVRKVKYQNTYPEINAVELIVNDDHDKCIDHLFIKSKSWRYEKEWRLIKKAEDPCINYKAEVLTGVYLGPEMDQVSLEIVSLIIRKQHPNAKLWKGKRSQETFSIVFDLIE